MDDPILARIEREAGVPGLAEILAERLAPTDLQSLLLAVERRRAGTTSALAGVSQDWVVGASRGGESGAPSGRV